MNFSRFAGNKRFVAVLTFAFACIFILAGSTWPDIYGFAHQDQPGTPRHLVNTPIRLSDDVMISLRTGYILRERGIPAFNRIDTAQASTSYIAPYLFAGLLRFLQPDTAIACYVVLGFLCVAGTTAVMVLCSESIINALLLVLLLLATSTNLTFALNGWDHLFQAFSLACATALSLKPDMTSRRILTVSFLLVLGTLFRPDGLILALGILTVVAVSSSRSGPFFFGVAPYVLLTGAALAWNVHQFGHLTPTTARLKFGGAPSLGYILKYIVANGILTYSALTLLVLLLVFYFAFSRTLLLMTESIIITSCCAVTAVIALYSSDYLSGARMLWSPVCVLAVLIARSAPALFPSPELRLKALLNIAPEYRRHFTALPTPCTTAGSLAVVAFLTTVLLGSLASLISQRHKSAVISQASFYESRTAQQFFIARWIAHNLAPSDGSIGFFVLGVSYDLPRFEIADFNGVADESIATRKAGPGMPGHNKWDINTTLNKWNPQAIVPGGPVDPTRSETRANSLTHAPYLLSNSRITGGYAYCYVPDSQSGIRDEWGFYLRKDVAARHRNQLTCPTE